MNEFFNLLKQFPDAEDWALDITINSDDSYRRALEALQTAYANNKCITLSITDNKRTHSQNNALHVYCRLLAEGLNDAGWDMERTLNVDISWTPESVKKYMWKPIQKALDLGESTTNLKTTDVTKVYEELNRLTSNKFGVSIQFPSQS